MRQVSLPYKTAGSGCWQLGQWRRLEGGGAEELPARIDDWDYTVPLAFVCDVSVDVRQLREEAGLTAGQELTLFALWEATSTGIREVGSRHPLDGSGQESVELLLQLDGGQMGGQLILERQVALSTPGAADPLTAHLAGSVVLAEPRSERTTVLLEGDAARFPTDVIDFAAVPVAEPDALWFLETEFADLEQSPLSAMRLYVNGRHPAVARALAQGDPIGGLVRSVIEWDVARMLIHRALENEEFVNEWDSFGDDTLGLALQQLIQRFWPGEDASSLRARRTANVARFEYQLQARLRLMSDLP